LATIIAGASFLRAPGGRQYWREHNKHFKPDFALWVGRELDLDPQTAAQQSAAADSA
jgi:hypothetical protein